MESPAHLNSAGGRGGVLRPGEIDGESEDRETARRSCAEVH